MIGAMLGDIAGSRFEFAGNRKKPEVLFAPDCFPTDDTWLSEAVACALNNSFREKKATLEQLVLKETIYAFVHHPEAGWGIGFVRWIRKTVAENGLDADCLAIYPEKLAYTSNQSAGNGCAMKVASISYFSSSLEECKEFTRRVTSVTHDHPDSYWAAECLTTSIYRALHGGSREEIRENILSYYPEVENMTYAMLNKEYRYTELAKDTVPQAMVCFLESKDFEDALKMAVSIGGDADTLGAITGALAESFYGWSKEDALKYWSLIVPSEYSEPKYHPDDRGVRYFLMKACNKFPDKFPRLEQMPWTRPIS